jgi:hypothetical protein
MLRIHMTWAQGWDVAPPRAIRNAKAWAAVGKISLWSERNAVDTGLLPEDYLAGMLYPAMKADVINAAAVCRYGGIMVGADNAPLDLGAIRRAYGGALEYGQPLVVMASTRDCPYNCGAFFPRQHWWIRQICAAQRLRVAKGLGHSASVAHVTGPWMWAGLIERWPLAWVRQVRTVPGWVAFRTEPKLRTHIREDAWMDPGCTADWKGTNSEVWK